MKYAVLARRAIAYLIDSLFVFLLFVVVTQTFIFVPVRRLIISSEDWFQSGWNTELYTLITISLPTWLYFSLPEASVWQATLGKHLLKLKTLDKLSGDRITLFHAIVRTLVKLVPWEIAHLTNNLPVPIWYDPNPGFRFGFAAVPVLLILYLVVAAATPSQQSVHDLAAKTAVIQSD